MMQDRKDFVKIVLLFIVTRILLSAVGAAAVQNWPTERSIDYIHPSGIEFIDVWGRWDSKWYFSIAANGYERGDGSFSVQKNFAFFPLYPLAMKLVSHATGGLMTAGFLVSNAAFLAALLFLHKLALMDYDRQVAFNATLFALVFPTSLFFSAIMTESLFLLLSVLVFYFARRGRWAAAGLAGTLAALTRPVGILLIIPAAVEFFRGHSERKNIFYLLLIPLGLLSFMAYLHYHTGDALAFMKIQGAWGRQLLPPTGVLISGLYGVSLGVRIAVFSALYAAAGVAVMAWRKFRLSYILHTILQFLAPLLTGLFCIPRYVTTIFPLYILLAALASKKCVRMLLAGVFWIFSLIFMVSWSLAYQTVM